MKKILLAITLLACCTTLSAQDHYRKIRLAADFGLSYQTKSFPVSKFAWGNGFGVNGSYFLNKNWGLGLDMHWMQYKTNENTYMTGEGESLKTITEDTNAKLLFAGPAAFYRIDQRNNRGTFLIGAAGGYLDFNDKFTYVRNDEEPRDYKLKGHGLAAKVMVGYDFYVARTSAVGILVSYTFGEMKNGEYTVNTPGVTIPDDVNRNLGHLNVTLGYRFGK